MHDQNSDECLEWRQVLLEDSLSASFGNLPLFFCSLPLSVTLEPNYPLRTQRSYHKAGSHSTVHLLAAQACNIPNIPATASGHCHGNSVPPSVPSPARHANSHWSSSLVDSAERLSPSGQLV
ncbi:unnamed protein product [Pleuronectes platessa]|uniref:Uncharacterized protein n=1 Tax=Pleuronectes platessa TaxID=8262 RepID=A0A9N7YT45_PLEPL|nr:unnamed protein product [Pleuronectes platessa]